MYHNQGSVSGGLPDGHKSILLGRMHRVGNRDREGVTKNGCCLLKCNAVLSQV